MLNHGGERGRLAAPGGAGQKDDPTRRFSDGFADRVKAKLFEVGHLRLDMAQGHRPFAALLENVHAEASHPLDIVRKICFPILFQPGFEMVGHDVRQDVFHPGGGRIGGVDGNKLAADPQGNWVALLDMNIRGVSVNRCVQNLLKQFHARKITIPAPGGQERIPFSAEDNLRLTRTSVTGILTGGLTYIV